MNKDEYIGDGLYASFDGFQFFLRALRADGDHWVALEPKVLANFITYVNKIKESLKHDDRTS